MTNIINLYPGQAATRPQEPEPENIFTALTKVFEDRLDPIKRKKARRQTFATLLQLWRETTLAKNKLDSWSDEHLDDALAELQDRWNRSALRLWVDGTQTMLRRRDKILEQIAGLLDRLDESYDEEGDRDRALDRLNAEQLMVELEGEQ